MVRPALGARQWCGGRLARDAPAAAVHGMVSRGCLGGAVCVGVAGHARWCMTGYDSVETKSRDLKFCARILTGTVRQKSP